MPALNIPMKSIKLPQSDVARAKPLLGFDFGEHLFHVLAFDFGDDGGAVGVWREDSEFCARISLDALAEFWIQAQRGIDTTEPGRIVHAAAPIDYGEREFLTWVADTLIELNPINYDHDDVCECSAASVEVILAIQSRLSAAPGQKKGATT
jgi:hypothetical protein